MMGRLVAVLWFYFVGFALISLLGLAVHVPKVWILIVALVGLAVWSACVINSAIGGFATLVLGVTASWAGWSLALFGGAVANGLFGLTLLWFLATGLIAVGLVALLLMRWRLALVGLAVGLLGLVGADAGPLIQPQMRAMQITFFEEGFQREIRQGVARIERDIFVWIEQKGIVDGGIGFAHDPTERKAVEDINQVWRGITADPASCYRLRPGWYWCGGDANQPFGWIDVSATAAG